MHAIQGRIFPGLARHITARVRETGSCSGLIETGSGKQNRTAETATDKDGRKQKMRTDGKNSRVGETESRSRYKYR